MAANTVRPVMPPLSLMIGPKDATPDPPDNLYDVALKDGPGLIHNRAPAFSMDWKDKHFGIAYEKCGWGKPPERCLIIRTEINPKTGTAFKNKLFATECVTPDGYRWLANVDLSKVAENDRKQIIEELEKLLAAGLDRLGKTEAETKRIEILPGCPAPALHSYPLIHNGLAVVTLQSAARLLLDPWGILPTNDEKRLFKAYQNAWQELSRNSQADHSLELVRFFARQQLVGGDYLWRRFQHRQAAYNPELFTLPGSVFVLRAIDESAAKTKLEGWLQSGLPQLAAAPGGEDWRRTPYLAANGYGEIAVNLKLHWDLAPKEGWRGLD